MKPALALSFVALVAGCSPSATVERTTPVASLQVYHSVALRVGGHELTAQLANVVSGEIQRRCGFDQGQSRELQAAQSFAGQIELLNLPSLILQVFGGQNGSPVHAEMRVVDA